MPVCAEISPTLRGLSPVGGKPIVARFDTGHLCSESGLLALREIENRLGIAQRLAAYDSAASTTFAGESILRARRHLALFCEREIARRDQRRIEMKVSSC